ncbi:MAG: response regulator [Chloroflexi bacterium]|jgi:two-component system cell cycle response regulator DivK|nr:response regulator [Chloroflexota bacterium]
MSAPGPIILYVEDNPENRMLVQRVLTAEGFIVLEAASAVEAQEVLQNHHPQLILMDINMPDMDGYSLTARLKKRPELQDVPILALTANVLRGDRERSLAAGCDGYIQKPIDVDRLPQEILRYLEK